MDETNILRQEKIIYGELRLEEIDIYIDAAKQAIINSEKRKFKYVSEHELTTEMDKAVKAINSTIVELKKILAWTEECHEDLKKFIEKEKQGVVFLCQ